MVVNPSTAVILDQASSLRTSACAIHCIAEGYPVEHGSEYWIDLDKKIDNLNDIALLEGCEMQIQ